jgi:hypothetical protein
MMSYHHQVNFGGFDVPADVRTPKWCTCGGLFFHYIGCGLLQHEHDAQRKFTVEASASVEQWVTEMAHIARAAPAGTVFSLRDMKASWN